MGDGSKGMYKHQTDEFHYLDIRHSACHLLQTVPEHIIRSRALRTGDGTHEYSIEAAEKKKNEELNNNLPNGKKADILDELNENFWGFGDKDMTSEDMKNVKIINKMA